MKRLLASVLVFVALSSFASLCRAQKERRDSPASVLARYPRSDALRSVVEMHRRREPKYIDSGFSKNQQKHALYATWFLDGNPRVAMWCVIDAQGRVQSYREVYDWATQAFDITQLKSTKMRSLQSILPLLPANAPPKQIGNLMIVSFRNKNQWTTRFYDRKHLPLQVKSIYKITGSDLSLSDRHIAAPRRRPRVPAR